MSLIGITGCAGSGKDTVAKMVQYYYWLKLTKINFVPSIEEIIIEDEFKVLNNSNWQIKKFSSKLKQMAAILVGCSEEDFENDNFKNSLLPIEFNPPSQDSLFQEIPGNKTYRWLLQTLGTEVGRSIKKDIWIQALFSEYKPELNWLISDVRFINEANAVKEHKGIIIKVERNSNNLSDTEIAHVSEIELKNIKEDFLIVNDGTIDELYEKVCLILESLPVMV